MLKYVPFSLVYAYQNKLTCAVFFRNGNYSIFTDRFLNKIEGLKMFRNPTKLIGVFYMQGIPDTISAVTSFLGENENFLKQPINEPVEGMKREQIFDGINNAVTNNEYINKAFLGNFGQHFELASLKLKNPYQKITDKNSRLCEFYFDGILCKQLNPKNSKACVRCKRKFQ